jgi:hypothetical protein
LFVDYLLNALCAVYSRLADGDVQQHRMLAALFDCRSLAAMFSALSQRVRAWVLYVNMFSYRKA